MGECMDPIVTAMIVGYLIVATLLGSYLAFRSRTSSDWAVAGGAMGLVMIAVGVAGTRIGGAGTYGVAGDVLGAVEQVVECLVLVVASGLATRSAVWWG